MVEYFDADASLMANFGGTVGADYWCDTWYADNTDLLGSVTGSISNIRAGGMDVDGIADAGERPTITTADVTAGTGFEATPFSGTLGGRCHVDGHVGRPVLRQAD